jgi:hypothetical protein
MIRPAKHFENVTWYVKSFGEDSDKEYIVHHKHHPLVGMKIWTCNCPDFTERRQWTGDVCKHIEEVLHHERLKDYMTGDPETIGRNRYKNDNWQPACNGTETEFKTRTGRRLLYVWQPSTGNHAYLDLDTDTILSDNEAAAALDNGAWIG